MRMPLPMLGLFAAFVGGSAACVGADDDDEALDQSQELRRCRYRRCRDAGATDGGATPNDAGTTLDSGAPPDSSTDASSPPPPPVDAGTACTVTGGTATAPTNLGAIVNASS